MRRDRQIGGKLQAGWGLTTFVLGFVSLVAGTVRGSDSAGPPELPKGTSGWAYRCEAPVMARIREFDRAVELGRQFRYFFPYAGSIDFDVSARTVEVSYDPGKTEAFARQLPEGLLIAPILDARADKGVFNGWTEAEYAAAARRVAGVIIADPRAAGVQIDVEPFSESHLPFYRHLREELNAVGKFSTMFVGVKNAELMGRIFDSCDLVVISGYDLAGENPGVAKYGKVLKKSMDRAQAVAAERGGRYLVGIPAAASWGEYESIDDKSGSEPVRSGTLQVDYVREALAVVSEFENFPEYRGLALWKMSGAEDRELRDPAKQIKRPDLIQPEVWHLLEGDWKAPD